MWKKSTIKNYKVFSSLCKDIVRPETTLEEITSIEGLWNLESIGIKKSLVEKNDDKALEQFYSSLKYQEKKYYVSWPFKEDVAN